MTDSLTESDIDRIYGRIQQNVDLSKIKSKSEFSKEVKKDSKYWNKKLNDFFWDIHTKSQPVVEAVPEIETIPFKPTPPAKRKRTTQRKKNTINVKASSRQKAYTRSKGRLWTNEEINFSKRLRIDGLSYKQIAEQLNRSSSSISTKLNRIKRR